MIPPQRRTPRLPLRKQAYNKKKAAVPKGMAVLLFPYEEKWAKDFLGQDGGRLSASRSFIKGIHLHACPAGGYFSMKKSNQKSLGEDPETPYASVHPARKHFVFPERD